MSDARPRRVDDPHQKNLVTLARDDTGLDLGRDGQPTTFITATPKSTARVSTVDLT